MAHDTCMGPGQALGSVSQRLLLDSPVPVVAATLRDTPGDSI